MKGGRKERRKGIKEEFEKKEGVRRKGEKMRKALSFIFMFHSTGSVCRPQRYSI